MTSEKLLRAVELIKSGNKPAAIPLLREVLQENPGDENAWLWLYACMENVEQKKLCVKKALDINPENPQAQRAWLKLTDPAAYQASVAKPVRVTRRPKKSQKNLILALAAAGVLLLVCVGTVAVLGWTGQLSALAFPALSPETLPSPLPSSTPLPAVTGTPSPLPTATVTWTPSPVATIESLQVASMDELESYRARGKMSITGLMGAQSPTIGWNFTLASVKEPRAQQASLFFDGQNLGSKTQTPPVALSIEFILIGEDAWVKGEKGWEKVDPADMRSRQDGLTNPIADFKNLTPVGDEIINGIACKHYTISEVSLAGTVSSLPGSNDILGNTHVQGDVWIANQPGLPAFVVRMQVRLEARGLSMETPTLTPDPLVEAIVTTITPEAQQPQGLVLYYELEVTEVNTTINIEPPVINP